MVQRLDQVAYSFGFRRKFEDDASVLVAYVRGKLLFYDTA